MVATARRSLLDPIPGRGRMGMVRDLIDHDHGDRDDDETSPRALMRHYSATMMAQYGRVPTLGEIVGAALEARTCHDDHKRGLILDSLQRTMSGISGAAGGFLIPFGMADDVLDRARTIDGPWARCNFWDVPTRQFFIPAVSETSVATGSRFGGIVSQLGKGEISTMAATDGKVALVETNQERLTIYSIVSRDLFADSRMLNRWLSYVAIAEMRAVIENFLINGPTSGVAVAVGPQGAINSPCTVSITRATGGQLKAIDIDKLAAAIAPGNWQCPAMAFYANKQTIETIDQLATSGQYPEALYMRAGASAWTPHPTLKGKPLIQCNYCPNVGTAGDLIAADFGDYVFTYLKPKPTDSALAFMLDPPRGPHHLGAVGMPDDAIEARMSDEKYFDTDLVAFCWKLRGDGKWLWNSTSQDANGNAIGPVAVIHA